MSSRWRPSRALLPGQLVGVGALLIAAAGAASWAITSALPRLSFASVATGFLALAMLLAAWGWPDWLSQVLRRDRSGLRPFDDDEAHTNLLVRAALLAIVAVALHLAEGR